MTQKELERLISSRKVKNPGVGRQYTYWIKLADKSYELPYNNNSVFYHSKSGTSVVGKVSTKDDFIRLVSNHLKEN